MDTIDFTKVCRVCMDEGTMMSLFKVNMSKKLMACATVQVWPNDGLPSQICTKCAARLHISYQFKKLCEKSDVKLRQYLAELLRPENKIIHEIETNTNEARNEIQIQQTPQQETATTTCIYVQRNNEMHHGAPTQATYEHFMTVVAQPDQTLAQIPYGSLTNEPQPLQATFNIDGHLLYPTQYAPSVEPIQQTTEIQTQVIQPAAEVQPSQNNSNNNQKNGKSVMIGASTNLGDKVCPTCNKPFKTNIKLNRHMKIHNPADLPHKCTICNKGFSHSGNFKIHMRVHTNERPFKCPVCNRGCRQAQDLEKHMRTHTGERPHKCHICPKAFATSSNLIAHIRTHTGERPYVCCVCQKAFCQSNELTKHMRTHTGEKSHVCDICNKGFNGSSSLLAHRRSHTGERPYVCIFCQKGFTSSNSLATHVKKHQQSLKCVHCESAFMTVTELKDHLSMQHNVEDPSRCITEDSSSKTQELQCSICEQKFDKANDYTNHLKTHSDRQES